MKIKIRNAKIGDLKFIIKGIKEIFRIEKCRLKREKLNEEKRLALKAIKRNEVKIAVKEKKSLGFIWFAFSSTTPYGVDYGSWGKRYCFVSWVYVLKEYRHKGIGSLLYSEVKKICKKKKVKEIIIDVYAINKKSIKFHNRMGFKPLLYIETENIK